MRFIRTEFLFYAYLTCREAVGGELLHHTPSCIVPQYRGGEEQGINTVKHATVAGKNRPRIFRSRAALDERFDQVPELGGDVQRNREQENRPQG